MTVSPPVLQPVTGVVMTVSTPVPLPVDNSEIKTGYLLDSAVQEIKYMTTDGSQNKTNADGDFSYLSGDLIEFSIGDIVIENYQTTAVPPDAIY
jgi:hypothetical protein